MQRLNTRRRLGVIDSLYKFPSTPHLENASNYAVRDDKVLSVIEQNEFLKQEVEVQEKVDGANLGISFDNDGNLITQNRGEFLRRPYSGQWNKLDVWLKPRIEPFFEGLSDRYILFGEWCYAKHSIFYDRLPDWLLGFDIFDKETLQFLSLSRTKPFFDRLGVRDIPLLKRGHLSLSELRNFSLHSGFRNGPAEGVYLRIDDGDWLKRRAKLVRPEFMQAISKHWLRAQLIPNRLVGTTAP
jgi:hypothetical protein